LVFDCYSDLMISWRLLARGGILAIDDYLYNTEGVLLDSPFEGVNHFLKKHGEEIKILHKGDKVIPVFDNIKVIHLADKVAFEK